MGLKVLGEGKVERLKRSVGYSNARGNKMKLWMVRATTVVLLWTCLVQLMALGESWGPRVLKGWPSHDSVISGAALDVKLLPVVPVRELPPKRLFWRQKGKLPSDACRCKCTKQQFWTKCSDASAWKSRSFYAIP